MKREIYSESVDLMKEFFELKEDAKIDAEKKKKIREETAAINEKLTQLAKSLKTSFKVASVSKFNPFERWVQEEYILPLYVESKNSEPYFGAATKGAISDIMDQIKGILNVNPEIAAVRENSSSIEIKAPSFIKYDNNNVSIVVYLQRAESDRGKIINTLSSNLSGEYRFVPNDNGSIRVMKKMSKHEVSLAIGTFVADISTLSSTDITREDIPEGEDIKYSGTYGSIRLGNISLDGFKKPISVVFTLAFGPKDATAKERKQREKLNSELDDLKEVQKDTYGGEEAVITIKGKKYGPFSTVKPAKKKDAKADIVFTGRGGPGYTGDLYISLKDGTTPKHHQQWGGMIADKKIMNDPRSIEFFKRVLAKSGIYENMGKRKGKTMVFTIKLKSPALWADIPPDPSGHVHALSSGADIQEKAGGGGNGKNPKTKPGPTKDEVAYSNIAMRAVYGLDAVSKENLGAADPKFGEEFCQFIIQSDPDALRIDKEGNIKPNGHIKQWPDLPASDDENNYTPIFIARRDNRDAVDLNNIWTEEFIKHIESLVKGPNKEKYKALEDARGAINRVKDDNGGEVKIKLLGARFLIYPYGKKSATDEQIDMSTISESLQKGRIDAKLLREFFSLKVH